VTNLNPMDFKYKIGIPWTWILAGSVTSLEFIQLHRLMSALVWNQQMHFPDAAAFRVRISNE